MDLPISWQEATLFFAAAARIILRDAESPLMALRVVTPAEARRALERMTPRRKPLDNRTVSHLAELMRRGKFQAKGPEDGEGYKPVAFVNDGRLASGRHRMQAVIESRRYVVMDVADWGIGVRTRCSKMAEAGESPPAPMDTPEGARHDRSHHIEKVHQVWRAKATV